MPARNERTSRRVASTAAKALRSRRSSRLTRTLAASALTQAANKKSRRRHRGAESDHFRLSVRLTKADRSHMDRAAKASGQTTAAWARRRLLSAAKR